MADVKKPTIHFIGLGGIGMSGIARMYLTLGYAVQGSDVKASSILSELSRLGIKTIVGHAPANVDGADLVVFSSSIRPEHPERAAAVKKDPRVLQRSQALAAPANSRAAGRSRCARPVMLTSTPSSSSAVSSGSTRSARSVTPER